MVVPDRVRAGRLGVVPTSGKLIGDVYLSLGVVVRPRVFARGRLEPTERADGVRPGWAERSSSPAGGTADVDAG